MPLFKGWRPLFKKVGIDLGTANTVIYVKGSGFLINEPSMIAYDADHKEPIVGREAHTMMGRNHGNIKVVCPMANGVIADFESAEDMIRGFLTRARIPRWFMDRVVVGVPTDITPVERKSVEESVLSAGARNVHLVAEPLAAAIGIGLDIFSGQATMIVDIGGGTTDIAVINYGGIVLDNTLRLAGSEMNEGLVRYLKNHYHLEIGTPTAERIKMEYGKIGAFIKKSQFEVSGLDLQSHLPKRLCLSNQVFDEALGTVVNNIGNAVVQTIEQLPPELAQDLIDYGLILCGGGALLPGLDRYLGDRLKLPVSKPSNPLLTVAEGTRKILEDFPVYKSVFYR